MNRCSFCEWIPIVPGRVWPLAGHARLGQNTVVGSMAILLSWLCWGACQEEVCLDPHFLCNLTPPRLNVELPALIARVWLFLVLHSAWPRERAKRPPPAAREPRKSKRTRSQAPKTFAGLTQRPHGVLWDR